jgi:SIR2-like domain
VAQKFLRGRVVPFLGAGVNRVGRTERWQYKRRGTLPDGRELAEHLATVYRYLESMPAAQVAEDAAPQPDSDGPDAPRHAAADLLDLARVSQFVALTTDEQQLYDDLHDIFASQYDANDLHRFFADFPGLCRARKLDPPYQLIVTTNYDDALERAMSDRGEAFDLFYYGSDQHGKGWFWHTKPDGATTQVKDATRYGADLLEKRSAILKIHGAVNRADRDRDSYVITEDDYIEYLADAGISGLVPAKLKAKMRQSCFLFLGYSMRDWNVRAFLQRVWSERQRGVQSWAIQLDPDTLERRFWEKRSVEIHEVPLEDYIDRLRVEMALQLDAQARPLIQPAP